MDLSSPAASSPAKKRRTKKRRLMDHLMNFRTNRGHAELRTMPNGDQRVVNSQKKGSPYSMVWLAPMARYKYVRLNAGGDIGQKKKYLEGKTPDGCVQQDQAKLTCTFVPGGLTEEIHQHQTDFLNMLSDKFDELLPLLWENSKMRTKFQKKAKRMAKDKTPEEQEKKAFAFFCNEVRLPFRREDENKSFPIDVSAFRNDEAVQPVFFSRNNQPIDDSDVETLRDGAILSVGMSINAYETPAGMVGIKMRLAPRSIVVFKNGTGRTGPTESELVWENCSVSFVEREGNVYANSTTGGRFMFRTPPLENMYALSSTEGKNMGGGIVEHKDAKYGVTMVETSETKEFFDFVNQHCEAAIRFMFDSPNILKSTTEGELRDAEESLRDGDGSEDPRELAFANFLESAKLPMKTTSDTDMRRQMKFTQRVTYPSGDDIVFKLVDNEGNDSDADGNPYTVEDLNRGDKTSQVIELSPWISPSGDAFGVSLKINPTYHIHIAEHNAEAANNDLSNGIDMSFIDSI